MSLEEKEVLKKHLTTPPVKKIDLHFPLGLEVTARNMKGVTIKDALDAIHKQFKKKVCYCWPRIYLLGWGIWALADTMLTSRGNARLTMSWSFLCWLASNGTKRRAGRDWSCTRRRRVHPRVERRRIRKAKIDERWRRIAEGTLQCRC